jgi:hypothetical protein
MLPTIVKYQVAIKPVGEYAVAVPKALPDVAIGDTLQFSSSEEAFRVVFENWPFKESETEVTTGDLLTFGREGPFKFFCYVTPKGESKELAYAAGSGGNGNVKPPGK